MMAEPKLLGKDISQLNYRYAGINHFHWHKVFDENGNDMTPILIDHINEKVVEHQPISIKLNFHWNYFTA